MRVGQRVVCADAKFPPGIETLYTALPFQDGVYTIRKVLIGCDWQGEAGEVCVYLQELHNPKSSKPPFPERGFNSLRFRPMEEKTETETASNPEAISKYELAIA